jgi:toxin ParE1/3/4
LRLRITAEARAHLLAIRRYTILKFGMTQARQYRNRLESAFVTLLEHPEAGIEAPHDLGRDIRILNVTRHRIFYRVDGQTVAVLAILHERQLPELFFDDE